MPYKLLKIKIMSSLPRKHSRGTQQWFFFFFFANCVSEMPLQNRILVKIIFFFEFFCKLRNCNAIAKTHLGECRIEMAFQFCILKKCLIFLCTVALYYGFGFRTWTCDLFSCYTTRPMTILLWCRNLHIHTLLLEFLSKWYLLIPNPSEVILIKFYLRK